MADLQQLVESNVQERKTLEYKAALPSNADADKKEFLADVSSLANTEGGDLVFGLREVDGTLQSEIGIAIANADEEIARLENMARDGILLALGLRYEPWTRAAATPSSSSAPNPAWKHLIASPSRHTTDFTNVIATASMRWMLANCVLPSYSQGEVIERIKRFRTTRITDIKVGDTPNRFCKTSLLLPFISSRFPLSTLRFACPPLLLRHFRAAGIMRFLHLQIILTAGVTAST